MNKLSPEEASAIKLRLMPLSESEHGLKRVQARLYILHALLIGSGRHIQKRLVLEANVSVDFMHKLYEVCATLEHPGYFIIDGKADPYILGSLVQELATTCGPYSRDLKIVKHPEIFSL